MLLISGKIIFIPHSVFLELGNKVKFKITISKWLPNCTWLLWTIIVKIKYERKERRVVSKRRRKKLVVSGIRSVTDNCPEHDNSYLSRAFVRNTSHGKVKGRLDFYWFKADGYAKYLKVFGIYGYCCHLEARTHALSSQ